MAARHSKRNRERPKGVERMTVQACKSPLGVREHGRLVDCPNDAVGVEHAGNHISRRHPAGKAPWLLVPNTTTITYLPLDLPAYLKLEPLFP